MNASNAEVLTPDLKNEMARLTSGETQLGFIDRALEKNRLPDFLLRFGIRRLLAQRLREENKGGGEAQQKHLLALVAELKHSPIAIETRAANAQHYEVPTSFMSCASATWPVRSSAAPKPGEAGQADEYVERLIGQRSFRLRTAVRTASRRPAADSKSSPTVVRRSSI